MNRAHGGLFAVLIAMAMLGFALPEKQILGSTRDQAHAGGEPSWACTFSIVAFDPDRQEWGIAVASKYLAVGSAVPFAKAGVGAVATQSFVNVSYGPRGLELLAEGKSAEEVIKTLTDADTRKDVRQVGIVDAKGNAASFTGPKCIKKLSQYSP